MQVIKSLVLAILISHLTASLAIGQEVRKFDITVAGISIGEMTAVKTGMGNMTFYHVKSKVIFWFFGWVSVDYLLDSEFTARQLTKAKGISNTTRGEFTTSIIWQNDHYMVHETAYGFENSKPVYKPLYHNSSVFFFEEPHGIEESMADNFGLASSVRKVKNYYEVDIDGNKNKFYYIEGKLDKAIMHSPIKNYVIKRK
jgi:hypothetical protein